MTDRYMHGQALLLLVVVMAAALLSLLAVSGDAGERHQQRQQAAAQATAAALAALLGWSVSHGDLAADSDARPGNLPCPARNASGNDIGNCSTGGGTSIGKLPWHSLAMVEPYAADGSATGYSLDDHFRRANLKDAATNSDSSGTAATLGVDGNSRGLASRSLIAAVEVRVLAEARRALAAFAAANGGRLPNAAAAGDAVCRSAVGDIHDHPPCAAASGLCGGRLPEDALAPYAAPWFTDNAWGRVIGYAVRADRVIDAGTACPTSIRVLGQARDYVLIAPGTPLPGQTRPSVLASDYFDTASTQSIWHPGTTLVIERPGFNSNDRVMGGP